MKRRVQNQLLLGLIALAMGLPPTGCATSAADQGQTTGNRAPEEERVSDWQEIERLIDEQKYEAATGPLAKLRDQALREGDPAAWTRSLILEAQLRTALHGYEKAVELLRREAWPADLPESPRHRLLLDLFYADGLKEYLGAYSWEIRQRERVESDDEPDLGSSTLDQILAEAHQALARAWAERLEPWSADGIDSLAEYIERNNYPERIRGTTRDAVSYLWVELLADSSYWRPEHSNEVYRLDLAQLISLDPDRDVDLTDPAVHPLVRLAAVLDDLESWHLGRGRPEAASEARLERLRRLYGAFGAGADRGQLRRALASHLEALGRDWPWWAVGQALLAEWTREEDAGDSQVRAREIALAGASAHPDTLGGRRCRHLIAAIEAPTFSMESMASDGLRKRSIKVSHQNFEVLYLRAYRFDVKARLASSRDYSLLPDHQDLERLLSRGEPAVSWTETLPPTPDYRSHVSWVTPPIDAAGGYVIVGSSRKDFRRDAGLWSATPIVLSDLVMVRRQASSTVDVTVRSGSTGKPVAGAEVALWRRDYQKGHQEVRRRVSDAFGRVELPLSDRERGHFIVAEKGGQIAVDDSYVSTLGDSPTVSTTAALIYTDRSIYRPGHEVLWKLVAYRGEPQQGSFHTLAAKRVEVELIDGNDEVVERVAAETNEYGSTSGRFTIPAGRRLGSWWLRGLDSIAQIQVEEYKRPTFEVSILDPKAPLRLNRPARLAGEARYYFGLPVSSGLVSWRVEREPVYPYWWFWGPGPPPGSSHETIAGGTVELDADGGFEIEFVPAADERESAEEGVTYRYRLTAEITDEGGETRSDSRAFRLGFVNVEATLRSDSEFFLAGAPAAVDVARTDLDGRPAPGVGSWRLVEVVRPDETALPAEQQPPGARDNGHTTEGDRRRARWEAGLSRQQLMSGWPDGEEVSHGSVEHGADGNATIGLGELAAGVYRLHYRTEDDFGAVYETRTEVLVVAEGADRLEMPAVLIVERVSVPVGGSARLYVDSGLEDQELLLEVLRDGVPQSIERLDSSAGPHLIEIPIDDRMRGGFGVRLSALRDHQLMISSESVFVPWDDRRLTVEFESFRDLLRPGGKERWTVRLKAADGELLAREPAELLAYMYDRSLDLFADHRPPEPLSLYPSRTGYWPIASTLGQRHPIGQQTADYSTLPDYPSLSGDRLRFFDGYPIGGPGDRRMLMRSMKATSPAPPMVAEAMALSSAPGQGGDQQGAALDEAGPAAAAEAPPGDALREDFSETAFWAPHLLADEDGVIAFEFTVPDSLTEWSVWVHALTTDLRSGSTQREVRTAKELMVRPYLPRFLREGDEADLRVTVNNGGESELSGVVDLEILDPETGESVRADFGLSAGAADGRAFTVPAGGGATLEFALRAPSRVGEVAFKVTARAGDLSDGELRPLPLLPGRMHLAQSRFATLRDADRRELTFEALRADDDPSRIDEQLVVTLDAQLFYSVLQALPYLVDYPYECTEQTLNRFLSTGIVSSLYERYPAVASMAREFSERQTELESWDDDDPNRKMALEETPWLRQASGGRAEDLVNVLDPRIARAQRRVALAKLEQAQTSLGGFPWWPGGPPSPYMTLYLAYGFSKALEFEVDVPRDLVVGAWRYLHHHYSNELRDLTEDDRRHELVTFLSYVLSNYPDPSWTGGFFTDDDRRRMLDLSFRHWREHSPLLKGYLALTLQRAGRSADARLVWDSVMDSARTTPDEGTFWAAEDRSWLWYNDTIESHAFALRVQSELSPDDERRHGLVQWLLINKKLNHWKSTRATAEVIYSLIHYLRQEGQLGAREAARVTVGSHVRDFVFEPDAYSGRKNQVVFSGDEIDPQSMATTVVEKETPGFLFASATWHFSTERLPEQGSGDLFSVTRKLFHRVREGGEWVLRPISSDTRLAAGDQVEVHLVIRARHAAEYVHLRDPRAAGFEPESLVSGYRWDLGIGWFEEVRDSGTNFFLDRLPVGEYTLRYRLRAATAGAFKIAPATLQSMYAPEFAGYSAGATVVIGRSGL